MGNVTRREAFTIAVGSGLAATSIAAASASDAVAEAARRGVTPSFTLLLVNDIYKMDEVDGRGGFARLAAIARAERAKGVPLIYAHAGDMFSPSLMSGFDQGAHTVELLNLVPPDVFVPGNHEFDFGIDAYQQRRRESKFAYFAANLRNAQGAALPGHEDRRMFELGPLKVGVFGVTLATSPLMSNTGTLQFHDEMATVVAQSKALKDAGADVVVAVAHTDFMRDLEIMRSRQVDVLLSGHDHDLRVAFDNKVVMVESGEEGQFVTAVDVFAVVSDQAGQRTVAWWPNFRIIDSASIDPDPETAAVVARLSADLSSELGVVIAKTTVEIDSRSSSVRSQETLIGDLICEAMRHATEAQICITNGGSIRGNRVYPAGSDITRRDVLGELPFGNRLVLVELTGRDIKSAIENGVSQIDRRVGRFPQIAGLRVTIDQSAPPGSRVSSMEHDGRPLSPDTRYKVVTNDFLFGGGDGYDTLARGRVLIGKTDGILVANAVMAYLRKIASVTLDRDGRISVK